MSVDKDLVSVQQAREEGQRRSTRVLEKCASRKHVLLLEALEPNILLLVEGRN